MSEQIPTSENRDEQAEKLLELLDRSGAYEFCRDLLQADKLHGSMSFEEFESVLQRINGIARDIPIHERRFDGENVYLAGFVDETQTVRHADKEPLLKEAYESAEHVSREDLQYMIPAVINAVHLFNDGNGRTSRIVNLLLHGFETKEEFMAAARTALDDYGRFESRDINPGLVSLEIDYLLLKKYGWEFDEERRGTKVTGGTRYFASLEFDQIRNQMKEHPSAHFALEFRKLYSSDAHVGVTALMQSFGKPRLDELMKNYSYSGTHEELLSPLKMLEVLIPEEWTTLLDNFYALKKEKVHMLIDSFIHPEDYKVKPFHLDGDEEITLREQFIKRIEAEYEKNKET